MAGAITTPRSIGSPLAASDPASFMAQTDAANAQGGQTVSNYELREVMDSPMPGTPAGARRRLVQVPRMPPWNPS